MFTPGKPGVYEYHHGSLGFMKISVGMPGVITRLRLQDMLVLVVLPIVLLICVCVVTAHGVWSLIGACRISQTLSRPSATADPIAVAMVITSDEAAPMAHGLCHPRDPWGV